MALGVAAAALPPAPVSAQAKTAVQAKPAAARAGPAAPRSKRTSAETGRSMGQPSANRPGLQLTVSGRPVVRPPKAPVQAKGIMAGFKNRVLEIFDVRKRKL
jgi:hypothetical protein